MISGLDIPTMLLQPLEWKQLHTLVIGADLSDRRDIAEFTNLLMKLHSPVLEDVTVEFRIFDRRPIDTLYDAGYINACLKFDAALSRFPRHRLSFLGVSFFHARKLLWMRELGQLFPTLRDRNRLAVDHESSERFGHSSATV